MVKMYKTKNNLEMVWWQLDEALGHIDNATYNISIMSGLSDRSREILDKIDVGLIIELRDEIGKVLDDKWLIKSRFY